MTWAGHPVAHHRNGILLAHGRVFAGLRGPGYSDEPIMQVIGSEVNGSGVSGTRRGQLGQVVVVSEWIESSPGTLDIVTDDHIKFIEWLDRKDLR